MYTVFSHSAQISYKAPVLSKVTVFYILATLLTFIPPLLISYRSQGFWQKVDTYLEQPDIHFQHELLLIIETDKPDQTIGWSTMENFNNLLNDQIRVPTIKSTESDWNRDGKLDGIDMELEMPVDDNENVLAVKLFLLFDVKIHRFSSVQMQGLAYVNSMTSLASTGMSISGDLSLVQKQPLSHKGRDDRYKQPVFDPNNVHAEDFQFAKILQSYGARNVSVRLTNDYILWERGSSTYGMPFTIKVHINYSVQSISYYPGFWQMLKWAWVQYISVLIVFVYFFRKVKAFVFSKQVLPSLQVPPKTCHSRLD